MDLPAGQDPVVSMQPSANSHEVKRKVSIVEAPDARNHAYDNSAYESSHKRKTSQVITFSATIISGLLSRVQTDGQADRVKGLCGQRQHQCWDAPIAVVN